MVLSSPFSQPKILLSLLFCWLLLGLLQAYALNSFGWEGKVVWSDCAISNILLIGAAFVLINILRFYRPRIDRYWLLLSYSLFFAVIWLFLCYQFLLFCNDDQPNYELFLVRSLPIRFIFGFLTMSWITMLTIIWHNQQDQKAHQQRQTQAEKLAREAELLNLREQLNPHFLFNSLNSINALVGSRPAEARHMIHQLSDFLRGTLKKDEDQWVSLTEELNHLQLYLDIEKVRFGHRLQTEITSEPGCAQMHLPPMLLQPIVENAIKFGLYDTIDGVIIRIQAECLENHLRLTIQNPFDPQTARPRQGTGFGLSSVQRRLYLLFARYDLFATKVDGSLFTTILIIPQL
ncbi:sensor histidine kinase [Adhaeribacter arboris]|uniref:Sensor histidine kinase n=1 Tax=Adhaeribacter arboris TaxID=2072846 RepID=A0A2T2YC01_9BACT|nr:sensor histidine kinase [Adhaeribacter arboris]